MPVGHGSSVGFSPDVFAGDSKFCVACSAKKIHQYRGGIHGQASNHLLTKRKTKLLLNTNTFSCGEPDIVIHSSEEVGDNRQKTLEGLGKNQRGFYEKNK